MVESCEVTPFGINLLDERGRLVDAMSRAEAGRLVGQLCAVLGEPVPSIPLMPLSYRLTDWWRALWFVRRRAVKDLVEKSRARTMKSLDGGAR